MNWLYRAGLIYALCTLALSLMAQGAGPTFSKNPYHYIFERNVFRLKSPPPAHPQQPDVPLPKITLKGITTILGDKRALLKVQFPARPFQSAKEQSFILTEGQRDGPLEVLEINEKTDRVKLDNSGTVMVVTFEKPSPLPSPAAPRSHPYGPRSAITAARR